jgi:hypothetical protein
MTQPPRAHDNLAEAALMLMGRGRSEGATPSSQFFRVCSTADTRQENYVSAWFVDCTSDALFSERIGHGLRGLHMDPGFTQNAARAEHDRTGGIGLNAESSNPRQEYAAQTAPRFMHKLERYRRAKCYYVRSGRGKFRVQNVTPSKQGGEDAFVHHVCIVFPFRREGTRQ